MIKIRGINRDLSIEKQSQMVKLYLGINDSCIIIFLSQSIRLEIGAGHASLTESFLGVVFPIKQVQPFVIYTGIFFYEESNFNISLKNFILRRKL